MQRIAATAAAAAARRAPVAGAGAAAAAAAAARRGLHASAAAAQQAKGGAKKGAAAGPAAPAVVEKYDLATQIPVNLLKEGAEPAYKPDAEYPPWLWELLAEPPLLDDLVMRGVERLAQPELKRVIRIASKRRIKEANASTRKTKAE